MYYFSLSETTLIHCMGGTLPRKGLQLVWQMLASSVKHCHRETLSLSSYRCFGSIRNNTGMLQLKTSCCVIAICAAAWEGTSASSCGRCERSFIEQAVMLHQRRSYSSISNRKHWRTASFGSVQWSFFLSWMQTNALREARMQLCFLDKICRKAKSPFPKNAEVRCQTLICKYKLKK